MKLRIYSSFWSYTMEIISAPILKYYDPSKPLTLQTDRNLKGLGAVLLQENCSTYFASKSLQPHQKVYATIELKLLAVAWAMDKFHHFLFDERF